MIELIKDGEVGLYEDFDNRYLTADGRFAGVERRAVERIPVIDISPFTRESSAADRYRVGREVRRACIDVGFFYLTGHGIPAAELDEAIAWGHRFFELPLEEKMRVHAKSTGSPGFMRVGGMDPDANADKAADLKERFIMSRELLPDEPTEGWRAAGKSIWPDEKVLPGFATFMKAHLAKRVVLAQQAARAFALSLDLPEPHFDPVFRHLGVVSIINYYPPLDPDVAHRTQWSFSPHTDYGAFTLLSQDGLGGLQVRNAAGQWIDVPPVDNAFVVNLGDLMATWTNDLFTSNLHRAANVSDVARISIPFFVAPQGATLIECLPTCHGPGNPPRYDPVTAGDYVRALLEQSGRTGRPGIAVRTAERFRRA